MTHQGNRSGRVLRRIAAWLLRSRDAGFVLRDLDDLLERDLANGMPRLRARWRYARNLSASWFALQRAALRRPGLPGASWLDVKLGVRLLARQPVLTLVAGFALAIGIPVGLAPLQLLDALNSSPPFHEGDRILGVLNDDLVLGFSERPSLHDFGTWRSELTSFERLGAYNSGLQNLVGEDGQAEPVQGSKITSSAFAILRISPLRGRMLLGSDEARGAAPVVVIGYDLWQRRFGGRADIEGLTVRLGGVDRQVVGVMPPDFEFPYRGDKFWVPLQARALDYERGDSPSLVVFGRLRRGISVRQAQAEVAAIGLRAASDYPDTHEYLRPRVVPFAHAATGLEPTPWVVFRMQFVALLLLAVACGNVGTLMLARAATRSSEIAVRTALGASRSRIVVQLFIESLVLAALGATAGLGLWELVVRKAEVLSGSQMMSWVHLGLTPRTVIMGGGLAVFSATIAGVLPAVKATGGRVHGRLQRAAIGASGVRFGVGATALIVAEVALAVGFLSVIGTMARNVIRSPESDIGITAGAYLSAQLRLPAEPRTSTSRADRYETAARFAEIQEEVGRRLEAEPEVRGVAFASVLPGMDHAEGGIEVDGEDTVPTAELAHEVRTAAVDVGYFAGLGETIHNGRDFDTGDVESGSNVVIVNRSFVERVLGGRNAVGRRIRYVASRYPGRGEPERDWYEIVGVVSDLGMNVANRDETAGVYHPIAPGGIQPARIAVHLRTDPSLFVPKLRAIVASIDPAVIVSDALPLNDVSSMRLTEARVTSFAFAGLASVAVLLSVAGLYALMSFTVSERTYEIAVRTALGARPQRVAAGVLMRALVQLALGVALGVGLGAFLISEFAVHESVAEQWPAVVAAMALVMAAVGLLACTGPTLRALRIEPIEALKDPG